MNKKVILITTIALLGTPFLVRSINYDNLYRTLTANYKEYEDLKKEKKALAEIIEYQKKAIDDPKTPTGEIVDEYLENIDKLQRANQSIKNLIAICKEEVPNLRKKEGEKKFKDLINKIEKMSAD